jgi:hypothetical protein
MVEKRREKQAETGERLSAPRKAIQKEICEPDT